MISLKYYCLKSEEKKGEFGISTLELVPKKFDFSKVRNNLIKSPRKNLRNIVTDGQMAPLISIKRAFPEIKIGCRLFEEKKNNIQDKKLSIYLSRNYRRANAVCDMVEKYKIDHCLLEYMENLRVNKFE
jgi:hypothetical protein